MRQITKAIYTSVKMITILLFALATVSCRPEKDVSTIVTIEKRIFDNADLLSEVQEDSVFQVIKKLEDEVGSQIAILTIDSLRNEPIEQFSLRMANDLQLGRAEYNDGILVTIARADRKARIEVGTGLENIVTNEIAARLIREELAPRFRQRKYGEGIFVTTHKLSDLIAKNKGLVGTASVHK
jgi:uncharacterized membrane protein YgcG